MQFINTSVLFASNILLFVWTVIQMLQLYSVGWTQSGMLLQQVVHRLTDVHEIVKIIFTCVWDKYVLFTVKISLVTLHTKAVTDVLFAYSFKVWFLPSITVLEQKCLVLYNRTLLCTAYASTALLIIESCFLYTMDQIGSCIWHILYSQYYKL